MARTLPGERPPAVELVVRRGRVHSALPTAGECMRVAPDERTEEGLRGALERLAEGRRTGDNHAVGQALLDLAYLVKWVRSDNDQPPFERSHALALEALEVFRNLGDPKGQISAILLTVPFFGAPATREEMLGDAERLASELGDDLQSARVLAARGRSLTLHDPARAKLTTEQALELFQKAGHAGAGCHFSLAILPGTDAERRAHALEAARLYRESGNRSDATKALGLAVWNAGEPADLLSLEPEVRHALEDAHEDGNRYDERLCYGFLARIAEARGDAEEAAKFLRWEADLGEIDGLTPLERWQQNVETTKMIVAMAKRLGSQEMVRSFQAELRRLKKEKP